MDRPDDTVPTGPTEVFEVLGNETRLRIIQVLAADRRENWSYEGRGFADLRKCVGVEDAGTFNYHLDRLRERFVVEDGDEYVLTDSGLEVADAIVAGRFDPSQFDTDRVTETETACPWCSELLCVHYENSRCAVACPDHGELFVNSIPPAGVVGRDGQELLRVVARDFNQEIEDAREGVCFHCSGRMEANVHTAPPARNPVTGAALDAPTHDPAERTVTAVYGCQRCATVFTTPPEPMLLLHPAVIAAFFQAGIDVRHRPFLDSAIQSALSETTLLGEDPLRFRVTFDPGDGRCDLVVDGRMTVIDSSLR